MDTLHQPFSPDMRTRRCCSVRISALALLKMAMHAKSGGNLEVMGMMQGKIINDTFIILGGLSRVPTAP